MAMNDGNVTFYFLCCICMEGNSWKEQQTLFACTQGRRRSIDDLSRKNRKGKAY